MTIVVPSLAYCLLLFVTLFRLLVFFFLDKRKSPHRRSLPGIDEFTTTMPFHDHSSSQPLEITLLHNVITLINEDFRKAFK